MAPNLSRNEKVKFRYDKFGGLAWFPRGDIFELTSEETAIFDLLEKPRNIDNFKQLYFSQNVADVISKLTSNNLVCNNRHEEVQIKENDYKIVLRNIQESSRQKINKPFWVHIQPFKYCNQNCIHCYCDASDLELKLPLSLELWNAALTKLNKLGVMDVYVSGGETLIVPEWYNLVKSILEMGFGTGLSTNAMHITDDILTKIQSLGIDYIQVSLDGATSETNDYIRGIPGAWEKTLLGIKKMRGTVTPVINSVISQINIKEIEQIILLGKSLGVEFFKFFPIKQNGRAKNYPHLFLNDDEFDELSLKCQKYINTYDVKIEYLERGTRCGSGASGFAVNEKGDIFPCIFSVNDADKSFGNILTDDIEKLWFESEKLNQFRVLEPSHPCTRCEG